jgi:hypothetical protein
MLVLRYVMCPVYHAAFFGWRQKILAIGKMDPAFSVTPDYDFYLRLLDSGAQIGCLPRVQVRYTHHPGMGAVKYRTKVETQRRLLHRRYGMRWYHELLRLTVGRVVSYVANPHRAPFFRSLPGELRESLARMLSRAK